MKALVRIVVLLAALATCAAWTEASSIESDPPPPSNFAVILEPNRRQAPPEDLPVALLTLTAFLALIAGNLLRWSDESWKVEKIR